VLLVGGCFGTAFIQTALVLAYRASWRDAAWNAFTRARNVPVSAPA
jgi:hypothetical protein